MNPKLEIRRANSEPKCASCGWWQARTLHIVEPSIPPVPAAICERHGVKTLDLAVCTDWRDGDPVQEVLAPESQEWSNTAALDRMLKGKGESKE